MMENSIMMMKTVLLTGKIRIKLLAQGSIMGVTKIFQERPEALPIF